MKRSNKIVTKAIILFVMTWIMILGAVSSKGLTVYASTYYSGYLVTNSDTAQTLQEKVVRFNGMDWYIIADNSTAVDAGTVTLFAKDNIANSRFNNSCGSGNYYCSSAIKSFLDNLTSRNGSFRGVSYVIADTDLEDVYVTGAKLWLLSTSEAEALNSNARKCSFNWWLRSPSPLSSSDDLKKAMFVDGQNGGMPGGYSGLPYVDMSLGVRPALNLKLTDVTFNQETKTFIPLLPALNPIENKAYNGAIQEPVITFENVNLTKDTDYTVSYVDSKGCIVTAPKNVDTYTVTVTGIGAYSGTRTTSYTIEKDGPTITAPIPNTLIYTGSAQDLVTAGQTSLGTMVYSLDGTSYSEAIPVGTDVGTYTVYYKVDEGEFWSAVLPQTVEVKIKCRVSFDAGEGTGNIDSIGIEKDAEYTLQECTFTAPSGKIFKEWSVQIGDANAVAKDPGDEITVTDNTNVTAVWHYGSITVSFDTNGGNSITDQTVTEGQTVTIPAYPTKENYTFVEWQLNGQAYDFSTPVTEPVTLTAVWAEGRVPAFRSHAVELNGQIGIVFYVDLSMLDESERQNVTMTFEGGTTANDTFDANCMNRSGTYYGFTCYINSAQMADTITATLHYGNNSTVSNTYDIKQYVGYISDHSEGFGEEAITLVKSIADYGHYMKPFVQAYGTGAGSSNQIDCYNVYSDEDIETVKTAVAANAFAKTGDVDKATITYTLALGSETTIYFYVKPNDGYSITNADQIVVKKGETTVESATVSWDATRERYTVIIPNINAAQLGDTYTVEVSMDDNGTISANVSALSYAYAILTNDYYKDKDDARQAMASLYYYYQATMNYLN